MKDKLISANKLCEYANNTKDKCVDANEILRFPSVDAEPVRHGYWNPHSNGVVTCSECCGIAPSYVDSPYCFVSMRTNYCPHCGARMDADKNAKRVKERTADIQKDVLDELRQR